MLLNNKTKRQKGAKHILWCKTALAHERTWDVRHSELRHRGEASMKTFEQVITRVYRHWVQIQWEHHVAVNFLTAAEVKSRAVPKMCNNYCNTFARFTYCIVHCFETQSAALPEYSKITCIVKQQLQYQTNNVQHNHDNPVSALTFWPHWEIPWIGWTA